MLLAVLNDYIPHPTPIKTNAAFAPDCLHDQASVWIFFINHLGFFVLFSYVSALVAVGVAGVPCRLS